LEIEMPFIASFSNLIGITQRKVKKKLDRKEEITRELYIDHFLNK